MPLVMLNFKETLRKAWLCSSTWEFSSNPRSCLEWFNKPKTPVLQQVLIHQSTPRELFCVKRLYICLIIDALFQFSTLISPKLPSFLGTHASSQATLTPPADLSFPFLKNYWTFTHGLDLPFLQYNCPIHSNAKQHWLKLLIPEKESLLAAHELILEVIYQSK